MPFQNLRQLERLAVSGEMAEDQVLFVGGGVEFWNGTMGCFDRRLAARRAQFSGISHHGRIPSRILASSRRCPLPDSASTGRNPDTHSSKMVYYTFTWFGAILRSSRRCRKVRGQNT